MRMFLLEFQKTSTRYWQEEYWPAEWKSSETLHLQMQWKWLWGKIGELERWLEKSVKLPRSRVQPHRSISAKIDGRRQVGTYLVCECVYLGWMMWGYACESILAFKRGSIWGWTVDHSVSSGVHTDKNPSYGWTLWYEASYCCGNLKLETWKKRNYNTFLTTLLTY